MVDQSRNEAPKQSAHLGAGRLRLIHTADWHLGAPRAHPIFSTALDTLVSKAREEKCGYILAVGDIFDRPKPDQETKDRLLSFLLNNQDIEFIFTIGNHDYTTKAKTYNSLEYLRILADKEKLGNVTVLTSGEKYVSDEVSVYAFDAWEALCKATPKNGFSIGAWHGMLPDLNIKTMKHKKVAVTDAFDYVALGDIHKRLKISDNCYYSGTLYQKTYSDEAGIVIVSDTQAPRSIQLGIPQKIALDVGYTPGETTEEEIVRKVADTVPTGNLIKLVFNLPITAWAALGKDYIKNELKDNYLEVILDNDPVSESVLRKGIQRVSQAKSLMEEIHILIEESDTKLDKKKLTSICQEIVRD